MATKFEVLTKDNFNEQVFRRCLDDSSDAIFNHGTFAHPRQSGSLEQMKDWYVLYVKRLINSNDFFGFQAYVRLTTTKVTIRTTLGCC